MKKEEAAETLEPGPSLGVFPDCSAIRISRGVGLKDLANATRIRLSYLDAIEKGDFGKLPEPIYAETFIKTYAEAIAIDSEQLMAHYRTYLDKHTAAHAEILPPKHPEKPPLDSEHRISSGKSYKVLGWVVSILVAGAFLVSFFATHMNNEVQQDLIQPAPVTPAPVVQATPPVVAPSSALPATDTQAVAPAAVPQAAPVAPVPAPMAPTSYKLLIEATDTTWVSIVEDDRPPFEIMLRAGERFEREAAKKFSLDVGNAGGVMVTFQGKSMGRLGQKGQVVHLTLPEDGRQQ